MFPLSGLPNLHGFRIYWSSCEIELNRFETDFDFVDCVVKSRIKAILCKANTREKCISKGFVSLFSPL